MMVGNAAPDSATLQSAERDSPGTDSARIPDFSVVVPAYNCAAALARSLSALRASEVPSMLWELIVVDDGSSDSTASVAESFADVTLRLGPGPSGPAFARNRGAERARGKYIVFIDSDVCVHPDALERLVSVLDSSDAPAAVFGAYDTRPPEPGLVSQYRNLLHHYVHWTNSGPAQTFWAGLGAIRRDVFLNIGMFDEKRFTRPQIEDIELGYRLVEHGYRLVLRPGIQGTHLKRWAFGRMVMTDLLDRAVPWTRLLLERRQPSRAGTLNIKQSEKVFTLVTAIGLVLTVVAFVTREWRYAILAAACFATVVAANAHLLSWFATERGIAFAVAVIPLRLLFYVVSGVGAVWAVLLYALRNRRSEIPMHRAAS
jgi:glycosyltransferase involved in cell wall biosynthesis